MNIFFKGKVSVLMCVVCLFVNFSQTHADEKVPPRWDSVENFCYWDWGQEFGNNPTLRDVEDALEFLTSNRFSASGLIIWSDLTSNYLNESALLDCLKKIENAELKQFLVSRLHQELKRNLKEDLAERREEKLRRVMYAQILRKLDDKYEEFSDIEYLLNDPELWADLKDFQRESEYVVEMRMCLVNDPYQEAEKLDRLKGVELLFLLSGNEHMSRDILRTLKIGITNYLGDGSTGSFMFGLNPWYSKKCPMDYSVFWVLSKPLLKKRVDSFPIDQRQDLLDFISYLDRLEKLLETKFGVKVIWSERAWKESVKTCGGFLQRDIFALQKAEN